MFSHLEPKPLAKGDAAAPPAAGVNAPKGDGGVSVPAAPPKGDGGVMDPPNGSGNVVLRT